MVQEADTASVVPQVVVWANRLAPGPVNATLASESAVLPVLVTVTVCDALDVPAVRLAKVIDGALKVTMGVRAAVAVPFSVEEAVPASFAIVSVAANVPAAAGLKVTATVHAADTASVAPQVVAWLKRPAFVPVIDTPVRFTAVLPVLVRVAVWVAVAPAVALKVRVAGARDTVFTAAAVAVPFRLTKAAFDASVTIESRGRVRSRGRGPKGHGNRAACRDREHGSVRCSSG